MEKWLCRCGYPMDNDASSDILWHDTLNKVNQTNRYEVWKCPICQGLMVFGEHTDPNCYTFYKKTDEYEVDSCYSDRMYRVAVVTFSEFGNEYTYICEDESIGEGHFVVVPVGKNNIEKIAHVEKVYQASQQMLSYPVDKLKYVIKIYSDFDKHKAAEIVKELVSLGYCLDLQSASSIILDQPYDIIQSPLGHWWLELNGVPIPMIVSLIDAQYEDYDVDCAVHIKPNKMNYSAFHSLKLCTDFDISVTRCIDSVADEHSWGYSWESNGTNFGITCTELPDYPCNVTIDKYSRIPYYDNWYADLGERYGFNLAWKPYESDDDLSIDFYLTW